MEPERSKGRRKDKGKAKRRPTSRFAFAAVIGLGILLGVSILFTFPPQDRAMLALMEGVIVGLGFIVYGATLAAEKVLTTADEKLHARRGLFRRRLVSLQVLESIYLLGLVFGFFRAFLQPRRTWPALPWILAGLLIGATGIGVIALFNLQNL